MNKKEIQVIDMRSFEVTQFLINDARDIVCINNNLYILQDNRHLYCYNLVTNYTMFIANNVLAISPIMHAYIVVVCKENIMLFNKANILESTYKLEQYDLDNTKILISKNFFYLSKIKNSLYQIINIQDKMYIRQYDLVLIFPGYQLFYFNIEFNYMVYANDKKYLIRKLSDQNEHKCYNLIQQQIQDKVLYFHQDYVIIINQTSIQLCQLPFQSRNNTVVNYIQNSVCIEQKHDIFNYIQLKNKVQIIMLPKSLPDSSYFHYINVNKRYIHISQFGQHFLMSNENSVMIYRNIDQVYQMLSSENQSCEKLILNLEKNKETFFKYCKKLTKFDQGFNSVKFGPHIGIKNSIIQVVLKPLKGTYDDDEFVITESLLRKIEYILSEIKIKTPINVSLGNSDQFSTGNENNIKNIQNTDAKSLYDEGILSYLQQFMVTQNVDFKTVFNQCYQKIIYSVQDDAENNRNQSMKYFIRKLSEQLLYQKVDTQKVAYKIYLIKYNLSFQQVANIDLSSILLEKMLTMWLLQQLESYVHVDKNNIQNSTVQNDQREQAIENNCFTTVLSSITIKICNSQDNVFVVLQCNNGTTLILVVSIEQFQITMEKQIYIPEKIMKIYHWQNYLILSTFTHAFYILDENLQDKVIHNVISYQIFQNIILINQQQQFVVIDCDCKYVFKEIKHYNSSMFSTQRGGHQSEQNNYQAQNIYECNQIFPQSIIQYAIVYFFKTQKPTTLEFLYQEYSVDYIIHEISNYIQYLHKCQQISDLTSIIQAILSNNNKIDSYLISKALIHWIKRQQVDQIMEIMSQYLSSPQLVFQSCKQKRFPDLCVMLIAYLGWNSAEDYFEMLNYAFETYSMQLADHIIDKILNDNIDISQYKYTEQHVWPILYLICKKLDMCVSPDIRIESDPVKIAQQTVNMINFEGVSNQQFTNFIYNGHVTDSGEGTIVCTGKLVQLQFSEIQLYIACINKMFPRVGEALQMLGLQCPIDNHDLK